MTLRDLMMYIVDNICIYVQLDSGEYKELFIGELTKMPTSLLDKKVRLIGASKKNMLDIQIWE